MIQNVKDAVAAGKIVTISQRTVSYQGWTGTGYIVTDPNTGAGAYLIGGGADGAVLIAVGFLLLGLLIAEFVLLLGASGATGGLTLGAALLLVSPQLLGILSSAVALIARGVEILTGSYAACKWYRFALSGVIAGFTGMWITIVGAIAGITYSGFSEFLNADNQCLKGD